MTNTHYVRRLDELKEWGKLSTMKKFVCALQKLGVKFITTEKYLNDRGITTIASMSRREWSFSPNGSGNRKGSI